MSVSEAQTSSPVIEEATIAHIFNSMADEYDDMRDLWYSWLFSRLHLLLAQELLHARLRAGRRCLDVGCGTGFQTFLLGLCGHDAIGIDVAEELVERAQRKRVTSFLKDDLFRSPFSFAHKYSERIRRLASVSRGDARLGSPSFRVGSATDLPFEDGEFDIVNCCGSTLSFVQDYGRALSEMTRVLRPGGHLVLEVENKYNLDLIWPLVDACCLGGKIGFHQSMRETLSNLRSPVIAHVKTNFPFSMHAGELNMPIWLFSSRRLLAELRERGLRPTKVSSIHSITNVLPSVLLDRVDPPLWLVGAFSLAGSVEKVLASAPGIRKLGCSLVVFGSKA